MKVLSVIGARPQFVKSAPVTRAMQSAGVNEVLVHTGQHYDDNMSAVFFRELGLPDPHYSLGIGSGSHGQQTGAMLAAIETVIQDEAPDWVLVYGDTNSTLAGALAAAKLHVPVAHVEAGLRSFNKRMPEELNRIVTDHVSTLLFVPTAEAVRNLEREGVPGEQICNVGDVMFDAVLLFHDMAGTRPNTLGRFGVSERGYILATVHRAENTDHLERLTAIVEGLAAVSEDVEVVLPLHPRTRAALESQPSLQESLGKLRVIDPVGYLDMISLEAAARLIATDSGGVQKEAFFFNVPCVTLRDETEWVELVELGWNRLARPESGDAVLEALRRALEAGQGKPGSPYGDGCAAERIVQRLIESCE